MEREIPNDEDVIALCTDCGSTQIEAIAMKDPFLREGKNGVCHMCGGVVIVIDAKDKESIMQDRDNGKVF